MSGHAEDPYSELETSIEKLIREKPCISPECSIFRAPKRFRNANERAFDPKVVSIGPFHHGKQALKSMEQLKAAYLDAFLGRTNTISLKTCIKLMKEWENRIRNCYAETLIEFSSDDFVKMILLDSSFIIEVIWRCCYSIDVEHSATDHLSHPRTMMDVYFDMILVENQLPFFVLQGLFDLAFPSTSESFLNLCWEFIGSLSGLGGDSNRLLTESMRQQQPSSEIKHLLDLVRTSGAPSILSKNPSPDSRVEISMPTLTELEEAGMVIKPRLNYKAVDVHYAEGVLEIPKFRINDLAERMFINLIAFEFCLYPQDPYISDYIQFMDGLIDTSKDVDLLIRNGILECQDLHNSQRVAHFFNTVRRAYVARNYLYYEIQEEVKAYRKVPWNRWTASLKRDYCSSPWIIASTTAALALLILTLIQTVCSIVSVT